LFPALIRVPVTASRSGLLLAQLRKSYRWVELDILANATRTPEFLAKRQLEDAAGKK
jgi:hypothetical protein